MVELHGTAKLRLRKHSAHTPWQLEWPTQNQVAAFTSLTYDEIYRLGIREALDRAVHGKKEGWPVSLDVTLTIATKVKT